MIDYLTIQLISILFAYGCGRHDAPAITNFNEWGRTTKQNNEFHFYNNWLKGCYVLVIALTATGWLNMLLSALAAWAWVYLIFDPVCNRYRYPKQDFFYIGSNDGNGRWLQKVFGKNAGKKKAVICLVAIVVLNVFFILKIFR